MKRLQAPEGVHAVTHEQAEYPVMDGILTLPDEVAAVFMAPPFNMKPAEPQPTLLPLAEAPQAKPTVPQRRPK